MFRRVKKMTYRKHEKHSMEVAELVLFDGEIESRRRESRDSEWKRTKGTKSPWPKKIAGEDNQSNVHTKSFNEMTPRDTAHYKLGFLKQRRSLSKNVFV